eukprot:PhM_4_TR9834/c0_g1_i5/m.18096
MRFVLPPTPELQLRPRPKDVREERIRERNNARHQRLMSAKHNLPALKESIRLNAQEMNNRFRSNPPHAVRDTFLVENVVARRTIIAKDLDLIPDKKQTTRGRLTELIESERIPKGYVTAISSTLPNGLQTLRTLLVNNQNNNNEVEEHDHVYDELRCPSNRPDGVQWHRSAHPNLGLHALPVNVQQSLIHAGEPDVVSKIVKMKKQSPSPPLHPPDPNMESRGEIVDEVEDEDEEGRSADITRAQHPKYAVLSVQDRQEIESLVKNEEDLFLQLADNPFSLTTSSVVGSCSSGNALPCSLNKRKPLLRNTSNNTNIKRTLQPLPSVSSSSRLQALYEIGKTQQERRRVVPDVGTYYNNWQANKKEMKEREEVEKRELCKVALKVYLHEKLRK